MSDDYTYDTAADQIPGQMSLFDDDLNVNPDAVVTPTGDLPSVWDMDAEGFHQHLMKKHGYGQFLHNSASHERNIHDSRHRLEKADGYVEHTHRGRK